MCLITFSYKNHPFYKLIVAANRDEFYQRPTRAAQFWTDEQLPDILAGKDLKANGTWMGVSKTGRWGALTNYRDPSNINENAPSRGDLVLDYLKSNSNERAYLKEIKENGKKYNGFNLLIGGKDSLYHFSNETNSIKEIEPGIHGVSNALLDTNWPKLDQAPDEKLPSTGIPYEWEKAVSSIFIKTDNYGTLCSTLLLVDYEGNAEFTERRYNVENCKIIDENTFKLVFS